MTTAIALIVLLTIVLYALQRNHTRQSALWSTTQYGSTSYEDRDIERVRAELTVAPGANAGAERRTRGARDRQPHAA